MMPESLMQSMALQSYAEATKGFEIVRGTAADRMVQDIGRRIAKASGRNYDWEFRLLDAPKVVNAFALPGGKVAVYSGLLAVTQNADALAAVVGHEVAHVTSHHGNERVSQQMAATLAVYGATMAVSEWKDLSDSNRALLMAALGAGTTLGYILPYSRLHETEADEIGLRFLIRAGYDPNEAPKVWERMARRSPGRSATFLSTHPDPRDRAKRLRELIPRLVADERRRQP